MHVVETQEAFAKRVGVTKMAITKAIKDGRIARAKGGGVNPAHPLSVAYLQRHSVGGKNPPASKQKPPRAPHGRKNPITINADHVNIGGEEDPENLDAVEMSQEKKKQEIIKLQLENAIKRGEYISRELTGQWVMRWFGTLSSVYRSLSGRVMPDMIAKIRSSANDDDALRDGAKLIDDKVYEGLIQVRDSMLSFRKTIPELEMLPEIPTPDANASS